MPNGASVMPHTLCHCFLQGLDIPAKHFLDCEALQKPENLQNLFVDSLSLDVVQTKYGASARIIGEILIHGERDCAAQYGEESF